MNPQGGCRKTVPNFKETYASAPTFALDVLKLPTLRLESYYLGSNLCYHHPGNLKNNLLRKN